MSNYNLKKIISILLVGMLLLTLLNACAKKGAVEAPIDDKQQNVAGNEEGKEGGEEEQKDSPESLYPIVDKPLTLTYWVQMHPQAAQYIQSYNENEVYQEVEKITGIHIDFIHPAAGQIKEQFNIMIASGELPDIIGNADNYTGGAFKGVDDGVFVDLAPYLEDNAPDYYKLINSDEEIKREVTREDGSIAAFYMIKPVADPPWRRIILREDWLNELGLEIPKTIEDYEKMFEALKEQKGVVPYVLAQNGMEEQFTGPFGVLPGFYLKDEKTVAFGQIQPEFKEYLALMNKWYEAGYIHKDFPALQEQQAQELFDSGQVGMVLTAVAAAYNRAQALNIGVTSAPYPRLKLGDKLHSDVADWPVQGQTTVVSSTSKYIKETIRWLNYAYTEEGARLFNYGIQGKSWVLGEDGQPKYTDYMLNNPKFPIEPSGYILRVHFAPKLCEPGVKCNPGLLKSPGSLAIRMKWADDLDVDSAFRIPPIRLTKEELDKRSKIMTEVNTYSDEMVLKFIMGAEPLENFDKYVEQLKNLGIEEAIAITQAAYDRYIGQ